MKKLLSLVLCFSFLIMPSFDIKAQDNNVITPYGVIIQIDKTVDEESYYNRGIYSIRIVGRYERDAIDGKPYNIDLKAKPVNFGSIIYEGYFVEGTKVRCEITLSLVGGDFVSYTVCV